jgi:tetratricopeptide (TPR) repeat protein
MEFFQTALTLAQLCADIGQQSTALQYIALAEWRIGDYLTAHIHASEAHQLARLSANAYLEARALFVDAVCIGELGNFKYAMVLFQKAKQCADLCGLARGGVVSNIMSNTAEFHLLKSEYAEAHKIHTQIAQETSLLSDKYDYAFSLLNIAQIDVLIGTVQHEVQQKLGEAKALFQTLGQSAEEGFCDMVMADLHLREGDSAYAKPIFEKSFHSSLGSQHDHAFYCLERLADPSQWRSTDLDETAAWTMVYLGYACRSKKRLGLLKALYCLGNVFYLLGDNTTAYALCIVALEGFTYLDVHHGRARCLLLLGDIAEHQGDSAKAVEFWNNARPLFELSLQAKDAIQIDNRLAAAGENNVNSCVRTMAHLEQPNVPFTGEEKLVVKDAVLRPHE